MASSVSSQSVTYTANPADIDDLADAIQGLTHPQNQLVAILPLWKRRGGITAAMHTNWVERLFVLTDTTLYWYELGGMLSQSQHGRIELRHIQEIRMKPEGSGSNATVEELSQRGPKYQLEVSLVIHSVLQLGGTEAGVVEAWKDALGNAVDRASQGSASRQPAPRPELPASLLRFESTGILAIGMLGKARQALTGSLKTGLEHAGIISHQDRMAKLR